MAEGRTAEATAPVGANDRSRIYLDHAATAWPKLPGVLEALVNYQTHCGASSGRGAYRSSQEAGRIVAKTRQRIAHLIGAADADSIALLSNGTHALHVALFGLLRNGDHVVTTAIEHNSVLRPLAMLKKERAIDYTVVACDRFGSVNPDDIRRAIQPTTKLIAISHASNVTGTIQNVKSIAAIAKEHGIPLLVDAAQTLGYLPIDVQQSNIDLLAAPGHKGAGGMLGTGLLYVNPTFADRIVPPWIGGTGSDSTNLDGPFEWRSAAESGNLNVPAIASLEAGLCHLQEGSNRTRDQDVAPENNLSPRIDIHRRLTELARPWETWLLAHPEIQWFGKIGIDRVPVYSIQCEQLGPQDLAAILDSSFGIEVRAGFHCAGMIHRYLDTESIGGTLRISLGHTSQAQDIDALIRAMEQIIG